ncbi:hypothetical protein J6590_025967 [Homalodisca vitripennis]|nr:hypothetical protein J6590_025967 [Homalodisca vitripennis]
MQTLIVVRVDVQRVAGRIRMTLIHDHLIVNGIRLTLKRCNLLKAGQRDVSGGSMMNFEHDFSEFVTNVYAKYEEDEQQVEMDRTAAVKLRQPIR